MALCLCVSVFQRKGCYQVFGLFPHLSVESVPEFIFGNLCPEDSDLPYREVLGMKSLEVFQVELDFTHVLVQIARGDEFLLASNQFLLVIDTDDDNGDTSLEGYVIEAFFPVWIGLAGSLGSDGQVEHFATVAGFDHLIDQRIAPATMDWHTTHGTEDGSQGPEEPLLLHHELGLAANGGIEEFSDKEVPIAGVRTATNDILGMVGDGDTGVPP